MKLLVTPTALLYSMGYYGPYCVKSQKFEPYQVLHVII